MAWISFAALEESQSPLDDWVRPIAYCEIDPYCQGILLNRMADGRLPVSPIWNDVKTLSSRDLPTKFVDIIYGGFPCQDISVAGLGKGLAGERSGLFWEIHRLAKEIFPKFIFLENVSAITSRGGVTIVRSLTEMGYDCRWCVISAASIGASTPSRKMVFACQRQEPQREGRSHQTPTIGRIREVTTIERGSMCR